MTTMTNDEAHDFLASLCPPERVGQFGAAIRAIRAKAIADAKEWFPGSLGEAWAEAEYAIGPQFKDLTLRQNYDGTYTAVSAVVQGLTVHGPTPAAALHTLAWKGGIRDYSQPEGDQWIERDWQNEHFLPLLTEAPPVGADPAWVPGDGDPRPHHEPGDNHEYDLTCKVCGQPGVVRLTIDPQYEQEAHLSYEALSAKLAAAEKALREAKS